MNMLKENAPLDSRIFTTEPLAMRALAAELRFDPQTTETFCSGLIGVDLGNLQSVRCESGPNGNLDLVLAFSAGIVGIEGKIGHEVTADQLEKEQLTVDHLIVLVKETVDVAPAMLEAGYHVATWEQILEHFTDARLTVEDINAVKDFNRIARRTLADVEFPELDDGWVLSHDPSSSGYPSRVLFGPDLPDNRRIIVQVETDRQSKGDLFLANIGISVDFEDFADTEHSSESVPGWIQHLKVLGPFIEQESEGLPIPLSMNSGRGGAGAAGVKMNLARKFGLKSHYATGYTNSYVGIRTTKVGPNEVQPMVDALIPVVLSAHELLMRESSIRE